VGAEKEYQQAIMMNPNYATAHQFYALFLSAMGRSEEAMREALRAQALDPLAISPNAALGYVQLYARRYDQAVNQFKETLEMDPNYAVARGALANAYDLKGMNDEAVMETLKGIGRDLIRRTKRSSGSRRVTGSTMVDWFC
jgi:tetratricopeptide (TPR) repeat protein